MKILYLFMPIMLFAQAGMPSIMLDSDFRLNTPLYQSPIKVREVFFSRPFKRFENLDGTFSTARYRTGELRGNTFFLPVEVLRGNTKVFEMIFELLYNRNLKMTILLSIEVKNLETNERERSSDLREIVQAFAMFKQLLDNDDSEAQERQLSDQQPEEDEFSSKRKKR